MAEVVSEGIGRFVPGSKQFARCMIKNKKTDNIRMDIVGSLISINLLSFDSKKLFDFREDA
jgi:hypothetical protein